MRLASASVPSMVPSVDRPVDPSLRPSAVRPSVPPPGGGPRQISDFGLKFVDRPLRIFLVEDSAPTVENLSAMLRLLYAAEVVGHAGDESTALASILREHASQPLDLVIIDVFLREGSGLGLLDQLGQRALGMARVVFSNYAKPEVGRACLALGADRFFDKSTDVDELIDYCQALQARLSA